MSKPVEGQLGLEDFFDLPETPQNTAFRCNTYDEFCRKHRLLLNRQQAEAVKAVDGPNLLLAVPGSGKTTVMIARIGYMIACKGITPSSILAMTYTKAATKDMNKRFSKMFKKTLGVDVEFRTINGVSDVIIKRFGYSSGIPSRKLMDNEGSRSAVIRQIMQKYQSSYPTDAEVQEAALAISYAKNMMLTISEISTIQTRVKNVDSIYLDYQEYLEDHDRMDYDDQMIFALQILQTNTFALEKLREEYQYICVDEAQDTSKIQHEIIRLLAGPKANLFMVGDEDQSIYGFRAAYPKALLDFTVEYPEGRVLLMERNYRSSRQIVDAAQAFISENTDRIAKTMVANRDYEDTDIEFIPAPSRKIQYEILLESIKDGPTDTAVLFRENDSMIPLANLCLRQNIPFKAKKTDFHFFTNRAVCDVLAFLRFANDQYDEASFMRIYFKSRYRFSKDMAERAAAYANKNKLKITVALIQMPGLYPYQVDYAKRFAGAMNLLAEMTDGVEAIQYVEEKLGYEEFAESSEISLSKVSTLEALARQERTTKTLLSRTPFLERELGKEKIGTGKGVTFSTVHSSKGLEYDTVYLIDVFDGSFPISEKPTWTMSSEEHKNYMEERRLFYVAITRARHTLRVFRIAQCKSSFVTELERITQDTKRPSATF